MQKTIDAVNEQKNKLNIPMFAHINHPNFGYGINVEDLKKLNGERFFEVYNGHPAVHNEGDDLHICLLYTSPSPRDRQKSRMPSSA